MKGIWNSFRLALSMYSIFPVRPPERNRENTKYILAFVPLVGALIGFLICQWQVICPYVVDRDLLGAVVCVLLPIFLSRGAFLDGFFRTVDALSSHKPRTRKLEILRDSHSGYFAIIICVCYFLLIVGIWSEVPIDSWPVLAFGFVLSRAVYGFIILLFPHTQESKGSLLVGEGKSRLAVLAVLAVYLLGSVAGMLLTDLTVGLFCLLGAVIAFIYFCYVAFYHFGGITEDIASFFVHVCEILMPLLVLLMNILTRIDFQGLVE